MYREREMITYVYIYIYISIIYIYIYIYISRERERERERCVCVYVYICIDCCMCVYMYVCIHIRVLTRPGTGLFRAGRAARRSNASIMGWSNNHFNKYHLKQTKQLDVQLRSP